MTNGFRAMSGAEHGRHYLRPGWLRDDVMKATQRVEEIEGRAPCNPNSHYGPVTVNGNAMRCGRCGMGWVISTGFQFPGREE